MTTRYSTTKEAETALNKLLADRDRLDRSRNYLQNDLQNFSKDNKNLPLDTYNKKYKDLLAQIADKNKEYTKLDAQIGHARADYKHAVRDAQIAEEEEAARKSNEDALIERLRRNYQGSNFTADLPAMLSAYYQQQALRAVGTPPLTPAEKMHVLTVKIYCR